MEQSVRYRFDQIMISYVKNLEFKTTSFKGYDRKDVYAKVKDLLIKARDVCESVCEEYMQNVQTEQNAGGHKLSAGANATGAINENADENNPDLFAFTREAATAAEGDAAENKDKVAADAKNSVSKDIYDQAVQDYASLRQQYEELQKKVEAEAAHNVELKQQLSDVAEQSELLHRANEIMYEARLEAQKIIAAAKSQADQEILLIRAKKRSENLELEAAIKKAGKVYDELVQRCSQLNEYMKAGEALHEKIANFSRQYQELGLGERLAAAEFDFLKDYANAKTAEKEVAAVSDEFANSEFDNADFANEEKINEDFMDADATHKNMTNTDNTLTDYTQKQHNIRYKSIEFDSPEYQESLTLRQRIMRDPLGTKLDDDDLSYEEQAYILGAFKNNKLIAYATVHKIKGIKLLNMLVHADTEKTVNYQRLETAAQIRFLTVDLPYQGSGIGTVLMKKLENYAKTEGVTDIFINARESADKFYEKLGYEKIGGKFYPENVPLLHLPMHKSLL